MRFVYTVVGGAILLALMYVVLSWFVDGYFGGNIWPNSWGPDSWAAPDSWSEWRDIVIVFTAFFWLLGGMLFAVLAVVLIVVVLAAKRVLTEHAVPAIDSLKESLDNVKGTTEFASETVASPIIRVYSVVRGVRSGIGAIGGIGGRIKRRKGRR